MLIPRCFSCQRPLWDEERSYRPQWGRNWCGMWLCWFKIAKDVWRGRVSGA